MFDIGARASIIIRAAFMTPGKMITFTAMRVDATSLEDRPGLNRPISKVRSLIDCLYNVTAILEDPSEKAVQYRKSAGPLLDSVPDLGRSGYSSIPKQKRFR